MKEIVVAIDFSKSSVHALEYAIKFANIVGSNITMVWVDNQAGKEFAFKGGINEFREEATNNLTELLEKYSAKMKKGKLSYKLRKGKVYQEIAAQARQNKASLIIAGTHGVTGYEEFWIGSNAYRIVSYAPCPVLTVRYSYEANQKFGKLVLPIDSTTDTLDKLKYSIDMAKELDAEIHLLALHSTPLKTVQRKVDNYVREAQEMLEKAGISFETESVVTNNITPATIDYATKVGADIIAIMTEQETNAASVLLGPYAQQMVNYSPIPVLSIQPEEIYSISTQ